MLVTVLNAFGTRGRHAVQRGVGHGSRRIVLRLRSEKCNAGKKKRVQPANQLPGLLEILEASKPATLGVPRASLGKPRFLERMRGLDSVFFGRKLVQPRPTPRPRRVSKASRHRWRGP